MNIYNFDFNNWGRVYWDCPYCIAKNQTKIQDAPDIGDATIYEDCRCESCDKKVVIEVEGTWDYVWDSVGFAEETLEEVKEFKERPADTDHFIKAPLRSDKSQLSLELGVK